MDLFRALKSLKKSLEPRFTIRTSHPRNPRASRVTLVSSISVKSGRTDPAWKDVGSLRRYVNNATVKIGTSAGFNGISMAF